METKLRVFLGSSSEADNVMRSLEAQLNDRGYNPVTWQGDLPREPLIPEYYGVGKLKFDPTCPSIASGWFISSPRGNLEKTKLVSRRCRKATEADAEDLLSDDREKRQQAVKRLLNWREDIR